MIDVCEPEWSHSGSKFWSRVDGIESPKLPLCHRRNRPAFSKGNIWKYYQLKHINTYVTFTLYGNITFSDSHYFNKNKQTRGTAETIEFVNLHAQNLVLWYTNSNRFRCTVTQRILEIKGHNFKFESIQSDRIGDSINLGICTRWTMIFNHFIFISFRIITFDRTFGCIFEWFSGWARIMPSCLTPVPKNVYRTNRWTYFRRRLSTGMSMKTSKNEYKRNWNKQRPRTCAHLQTRSNWKVSESIYTDPGNIFIPGGANVFDQFECPLNLLPPSAPLCNRAARRW